MNVVRLIIAALALNLVSGAAVADILPRENPDCLVQDWRCEKEWILPRPRPECIVDNPTLCDAEPYGARCCPRRFDRRIEPVELID